MIKKKQNTEEFKISDLPKNRFELFFDIIKNQWNYLIILAFIVLIIFLPLIIYRYYNLVALQELLNSNIEELMFQIQISYMAYNAICIIFITFIGVLFSGIARIYKKLSFNEGFLFLPDFFKGIKENIKDFLILFLIYGIINFALESLSINYLISNNSFLYYLFKIINYIFFLPILFICVGLSSIYNDKIFKKISLSFVLYLKYLPKIVLIIALSVSPLLLLLISNSIIQLFVPMLYCFLIFPLAYLVIVLFMNYIFDKEINKKNFPSLVNKGMYKNN